MSNKEITCVICDTKPVRYQWSDYHGEGMCTTCGCTYQLRSGSKKEQEEGNYPYLSIKDEFIPAIREYWQETRSWTYFGIKMLGDKFGYNEFWDWMEKHHPELCKK